MAFPMMVLLQDLVDGDVAEFINGVFATQGLVEAIDIGMLDEEDIHQFFNNPEHVTAALAARLKSKELTGGWATIQQRAFETVAPAVVQPPATPSAPCTAKVAKITKSCATCAARFLSSPRLAKRRRVVKEISFASMKPGQPPPRL